jgi:hypothetical protein
MSSMRCWMAFRMPILALNTETVQKSMLVMSRMASTISMILVESLFLDAMQTSPPP